VASAAPPSAPAVIDTPAGLVNGPTGEVLDVRQLDHAYLLDIVDYLRGRKAQLDEVLAQAEDEAIRRHGTRETMMPVGDWEVRVERRASRAWDVGELERTLIDLQTRGLVGEDVRDRVIKIKPTVEGTEARRLVEHLDGEALDAVRQCFEWKESRPRVALTRTTWPGTLEEGAA